MAFEKSWNIFKETNQIKCKLYGSYKEDIPRIAAKLKEKIDEQGSKEERKQMEEEDDLEEMRQSSEPWNEIHDLIRITMEFDDFKELSDGLGKVLNEVKGRIINIKDKLDTKLRNVTIHGILIPKSAISQIKDQLQVDFMNPYLTAEIQIVYNPQY